MAGAFVISLDFELMWGVRDKATPASYGDAILGGRMAIPKILDLFERYGVSATWATVGLLLARNRDAMMDHAPPAETRPQYADPRLSPYADLDTVGLDEREDPLHFGLSLAQRIVDTPKQTLGTHTFSHFYSTEEGGTVDAFEGDLRAAKAIAADAGLPAPQSIVFPRNQMSAPYVAASARSGIAIFRGNPPGFAYRALSRVETTPAVRLYRLADSILPLSKIRLTPQAVGGAIDVPATRFLRPASGVTGRLAPLHLLRIKREMTAAAQASSLYHLWWHPHNFGRATAVNLAGLNTILSHWQHLADRFDFPSLTMEACAAQKLQCI